MLTILMLDREDFDDTTLQHSPLGGAQTAFIELAKSLANRGHRVLVRNNCTTSSIKDNLDWAPLTIRFPSKIDLCIANRDPSLLSLCSGARHKILWLHNTAKYLLRWRHLVTLTREQPIIVFSGAYHQSTYPFWAPYGRKEIIPYGISKIFRTGHVSDSTPPPNAIFTSNPLRSLDWLVERWLNGIQPQVPNAQLHIFSGPQTYGGWGAKVAHRMMPILHYAEKQADQGIVLHQPIPKSELVEKFYASRVLLYRGELEETFCLAVAEAQAMGIPCVVQNRGSMQERIVDQVTGFITQTDEEFCMRAVQLLTDDQLWQEHHCAAVKFQRNWGWNETAAAFESLL